MSKCGIYYSILLVTLIILDFSKFPLCGGSSPSVIFHLKSALWYTLASLVQQYCLMSSIDIIGHISYICI